MKSLALYLGAALAAFVAQAHDFTPPPVIVGGGSDAGKAQFLDKARKMFVEFDVRKEGYITKRDASSMFSDATGYSRGISIPFFIRPARFAAVDLNNDGKITQGEYLRFASWVYDQAANRQTGKLNLANPMVHQRFVAAVDRGPGASR